MFNPWPGFLSDVPRSKPNETSSRIREAATLIDQHCASGFDSALVRASGFNSPCPPSGDSCSTNTFEVANDVTETARVKSLLARVCGSRADVQRPQENSKAARKTVLFPGKATGKPCVNQSRQNRVATASVGPQRAIANPSAAGNNVPMSRIVLAMSGGVDSSVAAWLLREAGHDVIGLFMRHGHQEVATCATSKGTVPFSQQPATQAARAGDSRKSGQSPAAARKQGCCTASDAADARKVAERLNIPFYAINFQEEFSRIIHYFISEYTSGRTPNPCVVCNTWLKFGKLLDYADSVGAAEIATGHYARLVKTADGRTALCRGLDPGKDQSYVLWGIRPDVLARLRFPVGEYRKEEIRRIAQRLGLHHVAEKRDSQEICFVPDQDHARFIRENRSPQDTSGAIVTTDGREVGRHEGVEQFTIGQRKGLGIAFGEPRVRGADRPPLARGRRRHEARPRARELTARGANWFLQPAGGQLECQVKIRYRTSAVPAVVEPLSHDRFRATFLEPCYGIAPGQAAVCYRGEELIGGGWID